MNAYARLLIAAALATTAATGFTAEVAKSSPPDLAAGEAKYTAVCAACHGPDGNSLVPDYPKLAQQHPEYLIKQLQEFKGNKRANAIMLGMAAGLSDEDMRNIAFFITTKKQSPATPVADIDKDQLAHGERIYRGGIMAKKVAACAGCHSPSGAGIPAQYPRLKGQQVAYTTAQLAAFRDGVRTNSAQMIEIAGSLTDKDIKAVTAYIATLP
jgi:cytochrome c553